MRFVTKMTPKEYKYDNIEWIDEYGEFRGHGYRIKGQNKLCLIRCPICNLENAPPNVERGYCAWCGFDANGKKK